MGYKAFLYRQKDNDDRDCCAYIEPRLRFECDHYFGSLILHGACYSNSSYLPYGEIETVLTKQEYQRLLAFNKAIGELGYGIKKGDDRYQVGIALGESIQDVFDKLCSDDAQVFFEKIQEREKEFLMDKYRLSEEDIEKIFYEYGLGYQDRSIVSYIFGSVYDCGYEEAYALDIISKNNISERYFDFEAFGEDLIEDGNYIELGDGRVVSLNY